VNNVSLLQRGSPLSVSHSWTREQRWSDKWLAPLL